MHAIANRTSRSLLAAMALVSSITAFAGQELMLLDAPQRAKVAKEKIRAGANERKNEELERKNGEQGKSSDEASCGSQSIGNIDTGARGGPAPREVFVFAPNAINIVGRGGCR